MNHEDNSRDDIWDMILPNHPGYGEPYMVGHIASYHVRDIDLFRNLLNSWVDSGYALHTMFPCDLERGCAIVVLGKIDES